MGRHYGKRSNFNRAPWHSFRTPGVHINFVFQGFPIFLDSFGHYIIVQSHGIYYRVPVYLRYGGHKPSNSTNPNLVSNKQPKQDPYEVLGIPKSATMDEITKAFRRKAKENHPDTVADKTPESLALAQQKTLEIIEAYKFLKSKVA
jgi:hypothetical protein